MSEIPGQDDALVFNLVNGATGQTFWPPLPAAEFIKYLRREQPPADLAELRARRDRGEALSGAVDPEDLSQAGWGVVFAAGADPAIRHALSELLDLRQAQAGPRFRVFEGSDGYQRGESASQFLTRRHIDGYWVDPDEMPYHLLLVGSPREIPYSFTQQLGVQYSVGRLDFDTPNEYANYARSVRQIESRRAGRPRYVCLFGVDDLDGESTEKSTSASLERLADLLSHRGTDWATRTFLGEGATRAQLERLLGGDETPGVLFTASPGLVFPRDDPLRLMRQGALLCHWPGPRAAPEPIPRRYYFAGEDLGGDARPWGLVAFHIASYSVGTQPQKGPLPRALIQDRPRAWGYDALERSWEFLQRPFVRDETASRRPFTADLPRRLLGHPAGGALAVVGHVEPAWAYSAPWLGLNGSVATWAKVLQRLLGGARIGWAMDLFADLRASLALELHALQEADSFGNPHGVRRIAEMWALARDAGRLVLYGDPAVRLSLPGDIGTDDDWDDDWGDDDQDRGD